MGSESCVVGATVKDCTTHLLGRVGLGLGFSGMEVLLGRGLGLGTRTVIKMGTAGVTTPNHLFISTPLNNLYRAVIYCLRSVRTNELFLINNICYFDFSKGDL